VNAGTPSSTVQYGAGVASTSSILSSIAPPRALGGIDHILDESQREKLLNNPDFETLTYNDRLQLLNYADILDSPNSDPKRDPFYLSKRLPQSRGEHRAPEFTPSEFYLLTILQVKTRCKNTTAVLFARDGRRNKDSTVRGFARCMSFVDMFDLLFHFYL